MIYKQDTIFLEMRKENALSAMNEAKKMDFKDVERDRPPLIRFYDASTGFLAEREIIDMFKRYGIHAEPVGNSFDGKSNIDIVVYGLNNKKYQIEVKTSNLSGKIKTISDFINQRDIKVNARTNNLDEDLTRDIYLQIVFGVDKDCREKKIENKGRVFLGKPVSDIPMEDIKKIDNHQLYELFEIDELIDATFFVGWATRKDLVDFLSTVDPKDRRWMHGKAYFYKYLINCQCRKPKDLLEIFRQENKVIDNRKEIFHE